MNIAVAMDSAALAVHALDSLHQEPAAVELLLKANKREIFALARANMHAQGQVGVDDRVRASRTVEELLAVTQHVQQMFPEID